MKFENTKVWGFEHAMRGMRNPMNSWDKSDSYYEYTLEAVGNGSHQPTRIYIIGENDMKLAQKLIRAGSEHRKFMRQIFVSVDITAPLYWWKEFDTYKIGTVSNSTSTMHKLASAPITLECFETGDYTQVDSRINIIIELCEDLRQKYLETKDKVYWKELIRWLPESWLQKRTVTMNYENLLSMCSKGQRRSHKLNEWSGADDPQLPNFISWARTLRYAQELIFLDELDEETESAEE